MLQRPVPVAPTETRYSTASFAGLILRQGGLGHVITGIRVLSLGRTVLAGVLFLFLVLDAVPPQT